MKSFSFRARSQRKPLLGVMSTMALVGLLSIMLPLAASAFTVLYSYNGSPDGVYNDNDDCVFVMGSADAHGPGQVLADYVQDNSQLCFDLNGWAYTGGNRGAELYHSQFGTIDMAWTTNTDFLVNIDFTTGLWNGVGKFSDLPTSLSKTDRDRLTANPYVFFTNETCAEGSPCAGVDLSTYQVNTYMDAAGPTGVISGWAWSPGLGDWVSFEPTPGSAGASASSGGPTGTSSSGSGSSGSGSSGSGSDSGVTIEIETDSLDLFSPKLESSVAPLLASTDEDVLAEALAFTVIDGGGSGSGSYDGDGQMPASNDEVYLFMEYPPDSYRILVDILANETGMDGISQELGPDDVDLSTAPVGDGADFWRVRVQFLDTLTGAFLDETEVSSLLISVDKTADSLMYVNQVENERDLLTYTAGPTGVYEGGYNAGVTECDNSDAYNNGYCIMTEADGSTSFNYIIKGVPTSNMLGVDDDANYEVDYAADREGCIWIYADQEALAGAAQTCPATSTDEDEKSEVFYARQNNRNKYEIEDISIYVGFTSSDYVIYEYDNSDSDGPSLTEESAKGTPYYVYTPASDQTELSFRPRYLISKFVAVHDDGEEYVQISDDIEEDQLLRTNAEVLPLTDYFTTAHTSTTWEDLYVDYQVEADYTGPDATMSDYYLLIDSDKPQDDIPDMPYRTDRVNSAGSYNRNYSMGYGQREDLCSTLVPCATVDPSTVDYLENPTAEQWVCDDLGEYDMFDPICYYTAYLPIQDRRADAGEFEVDGAINATADEAEYFSSLTDDEAFFLGGSIEATSLRNAMVAQFYRYALGETASGCTVDLSSGTPVSSGSCQVMLNGRLIWADGDVTVSNGSGTSSHTIVSRGGNIYIDDDIDVKTGFFAIKGEDGTGNMYIANDVMNMKANIMLDGSLFGYDGTVIDGVPTYSSIDDRHDERNLQLWIDGSLLSRNTIDGSTVTESCDSGASTSMTSMTTSVSLLCYPKGDGTGTPLYSEAVEYDLNLTRQFRMCYPIDESGNVDWDGDLEDCEEGQRSDYTDADGNESDASFILTSSPADDLPVFAVESAVLN